MLYYACNSLLEGKPYQDLYIKYWEQEREYLFSIFTMISLYLFLQLIFIVQRPPWLQDLAELRQNRIPSQLSFFPWHLDTMQVQYTYLKAELWNLNFAYNRKLSSKRRNNIVIELTANKVSKWINAKGDSCNQMAVSM